MAKQRLRGAARLAGRALFSSGFDQVGKFVVAAAREIGERAGALFDELRTPLLGVLKASGVAGAGRVERRELRLHGFEIQPAEIAGELALGAPARDVGLDPAREVDSVAHLLAQIELRERRLGDLHQLARELARTLT